MALISAAPRRHRCHGDRVVTGTSRYLTNIHNVGMGGGGGAPRPERSQLSESLNDVDWSFLPDDRDVIARPPAELPAGPAVPMGALRGSSPLLETGLEGAWEWNKTRRTAIVPLNNYL